MIRREASDDDPLDIQDLPAAEEEHSDSDSLFVADDGSRRSKRGRAFTLDGSPDSAFELLEPGAKRKKDADPPQHEGESDPKNKIIMDTSYEGFSIYGRVLCLVVKRRDLRGKTAAKSGGPAMMEDWITSTQMPPPDVD